MEFMVPSATADWHWTNAQGDPIPVSEWELVASLADGAIPVDSLVWRQGWKRWLPANRVSELSAAIPKQRQLSVLIPAVDPGVTRPPPLPRELFEKRAPSTVPPAPRTHALVRRPAAHTLMDSEEIRSNSGTLRPPGAVPPPPRHLPSAIREVPSEGAAEAPLHHLVALAPAAETLPPPTSARHMTPMPARCNTPAPGMRRRTPYPATRAVSSGPPASANFSPLSSPPECSPIPGFRQDDDLPTLPHLAPPERSPDPTPDLPTLPYGPLELAPADEALTLPYSPPVSSRPSHSPSPVSRRPRPRAKGWRLAAIGLAVMGVVAVGWAWRARSNATAVKAARSHVTPATTPRVSTAACVGFGPAARLAPTTVLGVMPVVVNAQESGRLAIGLAESATSAAGLFVNIEDLSVRYAFREPGTSKVVSVVPLSAGSELRFAVTRDDTPLRQARVVVAQPDFLFGLGETGFARQLPGQPPEEVWAVTPGLAVTEPRIASAGPAGHVVAFRQGGQSGRIAHGWLARDGRGRLGPWLIESTAHFVGTPAVAVSGEELLLAFASRQLETEPWGLSLARASFDAPAEPARRFGIPAGGPGGDVITPALTRLSGDRWLLQWAEGPPGQRQLRVQTLSDALGPLGSPVTLSPLGSNAGQGVLWFGGQRAVSVFVVNVAKGAELWAARMDCPL